MTKTAKRANPFPHGIPRTFTELVRVWVPKAIHGRVEFENASEIMNALAGHNLNKDQEDYLETIAILVDEYDRTHHEQTKEKRPPSQYYSYWLKSTALADVSLGRSSAMRLLGALSCEVSGPLR
jgi:hypothetical protein